MSGADRRQHLRTAMSATIRLVHDELGEFTFSTADVSDGGLFIIVGDQAFEPAIGDLVTVQVQGMPVPAPILDMKVVRRTDDGLGLRFELDPAQEDAS